MDRGLSVLFVDDEELILRALERVLAKSPDLDVHFANTRQEAICILESAGIGVVITDYRMPERTGLSLLADVRKRWPAIVRVLMSGDIDLPERADRDLVEAFIAKPFVLEDLERVFDQARARSVLAS